MNLERVLNEIKIEGVYLRGDSKVSFENDIAKLSLNLKDSSLIQDLIPNLPWEFKNQINYPNFTKISELTKLPIQKKGNNVGILGIRSPLLIYSLHSTFNLLRVFLCDHV